MKKIFSLILLVTTMTALGDTRAIKKDVILKNNEFSKLIFDALSKNIPPKLILRAGGGLKLIDIPGLISCSENTKLIARGERIKSYSCTLAKGAWNELGQNFYGSSGKEKLTKELYAALGVEEIKEEVFFNKTIEYNTPDQEGGTERNLLSCILPTKMGENYGFRATCQVANAL